MKILILHGPNLNLLGTRETDIYGLSDLKTINARLKTLGEELGAEVEARQTNSEGKLIDWLHAATCEAIVLNGAAWTHYSYALRDAIAAIQIPVIEVHLSNTAARSETWRHTSVIAPVCVGTIAGIGDLSYELGLRAAVEIGHRGHKGAEGHRGKS